MAAVGCPALLLEAGDGPMPPGQMAEMARRMRNAHHVRIPDAGHVVHDDAAEAFRAAVRDLLAVR